MLRGNDSGQRSGRSNLERNVACVIPPGTGTGTGTGFGRGPSSGPLSGGGLGKGVIGGGTSGGSATGKAPWGNRGNGVRVITIGGGTSTTRAMAGIEAELG